ncbi:copper amine oxidase N-terminal domain-containing protein [Paenibacillus sp. TRM 82003]|nr:copper amine oxidase N-terminal domain-containing protein [Paenibacillus sp. TRM 82003]
MLAPVLTAGPAAAAEPPISITFDGEPLVADAAPFIRDGTTFVPFRALFERLGMQVAWDAATKTITGEGGGASIALRVGGPEAIVDGDAKPLAKPPVIVGGRTYVPLRFVSESVGADVVWNAAQRSIAVTSGAPKVEEEAAIRTAYEQFVQAANREDVTAIERLLHPESPLRTTIRFSLADAFERRDVETTIASLVVEEQRASSAVVYTTEDNVKTLGAYYMDNRVDLATELRKDASGAWTVHGATVLQREWRQPFGSGGAAHTVTPADEAAAKNTMAAYMEALNQEDASEALRLVDPDSPMRKETEATLAWVFETYDLTHELESTKVLERSGDEMYVFTVQAMRKTAGPKLADARTETIHTLRLQRDGAWAFYSTVPGETETLSIPQ